MPIEFAFFDDPALICIRYTGHITADDLIESATKFDHEMAEHSCHPYFFDFSGVTGYTIDHTKFMLFMARLADIYPSRGDEQLFVFYAPSGAPAEMAELGRRSWDGNTQILIRIAETRDNAIDILGGSRKDLGRHLTTFTA